MISTIAGVANCTVSVAVFREVGSSILASIPASLPSDAFDYAAQAQGYFRFAIQDMDATRIEIEIFRGGETLELIQITRD